MQEFIETSHPLRYKSASDLAIHHVGWEQCPPGYHYGPRICPYHIIHFVFSGSGTLFIDQSAQKVQAGQAFLIPADKIASYEASADDPWKYYWIGFLGTNASGYVRLLMTISQGTGIFSLPDISPYCQAIEEASHFSENSISSFFLTNSALFFILGRIFHDLGCPKQQETVSPLPDEIRYYLETKYSEKIRLTDVASYFAIHPNYMTRIFRERFAITPKQYLNQLKMEKAGNLLVSTDASVALISSSLGFEDPLSFSKAFHRYFRQSPSAYRDARRRDPQPVKETVHDYVRYT